MTTTKDASLRKHSAFAVACVALVCCSIVAPATAADAEKTHCRYVNLKTLPITVSGLQATVEGRINDSPVSFSIDSGAWSTVLFRKTAERLDLFFGHSGRTAYGVGGETMQYEGYVKELAIGPVTGKRLRLPIIWESSERLTADGSVGADFLFQRDLELNMAEHYVKFFYPIDCDGDVFLAYWNKNASVVPMSDIGPNDVRKVVKVQVNDAWMEALVDTGATRSVIDLKAASRAGITPQSPGVLKTANLAGIGKGGSEAWIAPIKSFAIGDETVTNVKMVIADIFGSARDEMRGRARDALDDQPEMILGADFLQSHRVLFANSQRRLYFSYTGGPIFLATPSRIIAVPTEPAPSKDPQ
jgi:predicted aspartyl protease